MGVMPTIQRLDPRPETFAVLPDGRPVTRWSFGWPGRVTAQLLDLGARLHELCVPDRAGRMSNVVLGAADPADYLGPARYLGATVGRYANRIAGGDLPLGGRRHTLRTQPDGITLHGGPDGFDTRLWAAEPLVDGERLGVRFRLESPDGDQGFPGALTATVDYLLDPDGVLRLHYRATADARTVVNLTNHAYLNLAGHGDVLDHALQVEADAFLPVDDSLIPLGPAEPVADTPFDLTRPLPLRVALAEAHPQLATAGDGFDHNWVLRPDGTGDTSGPVDTSDTDGTGGTRLRRAATLTHPASGRRVECLTTEPGLQVYTGNHFAADFTGNGGARYAKHAGLALETQRFPDAPHRPGYPSAELAPGAEYRSTTEYRFGVDR
jgi:aldose 1-epimerase